MAERENGCVTNFPRENPKFTIWKSGDYFRAEEFGIVGRRLPIQGDPVFQDLAREVHRLACEVGRLRRAEIDAKHGIDPAVAEKILEAGAAQAEALIADWLERRAIGFLAKAGEDKERSIQFANKAGALREAAEAVRQGGARREAEA